VVAHYQDSCVPLGNLVWTGGTEVTWITERSREKTWETERSRRVSPARLPSPGG